MSEPITREQAKAIALDILSQSEERRITEADLEARRNQCPECEELKAEIERLKKEVDWLKAKVERLKGAAWKVETEETYEDLPIRRTTDER